MRELTRRTFLRGAAGAALALPWLESWPAAAAERPPVRLLFVYVPNGMHMPEWTPAAPGPLRALPPLLQPLAPLREDVLVISGLTLDGARAHGDGPGDHARAVAAFLTCAHPRKTAGEDLQVGVSVDQVAAQRIGRATRFPSLELGCERGAQSGSCDSGYSCAYSSNLSWHAPGSPRAKEVDPRRVFERLFVNPDDRLPPAERARRARYRGSVLDLVQEEATALRARLGRRDRDKLDEYATSVRELERRLDEAAAAAGPDPGMEAPTGIPGDFGAHIRLMYDLAALALETDQTRVVSVLVANAGSNRSYRDLGVPEGHHDLSHHGRDADKQAKVARINRFHVEQLAHLLGRLKRTREEGGTLLDRTLVVFGSGISDGDRHNHDDLPVLVCGRGGGAVAPGRHLRVARETPLANLYLSALQAAGAAVPSFGDSTGPLAGLGG